MVQSDFQNTSYYFARIAVISNILYMQKRLEELPKLAEEARKENKKYFVNLRKRTPKILDSVKQPPLFLQILIQHVFLNI